MPCTPRGSKCYHVPHGRQMPLPSVGPWRHLLRPERIRLPGGQGDPVQGGLGVGGAQVIAERHADDHLPRRLLHTGAGLAVAPCRASRAPRTLTAPTAGLAGVRPPPVPPGGSPCSSGNGSRGWYRRRAWCRMSGDHM